MKEARFAGKFYEIEKKSLKKQIEACFKHKLGASKINKSSDKIYSIIVPHAGYIYSGPCASHAYAELMSLDKKEKKDTTFIILGTDHSGSGSDFSVSLENFSTPLGIAENNQEFSHELLKNAIIKQDEFAHKDEHSIEVQIPFLQYCIKKFKIVPILCSTHDYKKIQEFSRILSDTIKKQKQKNQQFIIIASSDLTHYGPSYGFVPFPVNPETKKRLYALDNSIITHIIEMNPKSFYEKALQSTVCGVIPITVAIISSKLLGSKTCQLLKYYTSGDLFDNYIDSVGYASIVMK